MPVSHSRSAGWTGVLLPGSAILAPACTAACAAPARTVPAHAALQLCPAEPQLQISLLQELPWRSSALQLSTVLFKNNNYKALITLSLSLVSLLSITLKGS